MVFYIFFFLYETYPINWIYHTHTGLCWTNSYSIFLSFAFPFFKLFLVCSTTLFFFWLLVTDYLSITTVAVMPVCLVTLPSKTSLPPLVLYKRRLIINQLRVAYYHVLCAVFGTPCCSDGDASSCLVFFFLCWHHLHWTMPSKTPHTLAHSHPNLFRLEPLILKILLTWHYLQGFFFVLRVAMPHLIPLFIFIFKAISFFNNFLNWRNLISGFLMKSKSPNQTLLLIWIFLSKKLFFVKFFVVVNVVWHSSVPTWQDTTTHRSITNRNVTTVHSANNLFKPWYYNLMIIFLFSNTPCSSIVVGFFLLFLFMSQTKVLVAEQKVLPATTPKTTHDEPIDFTSLFALAVHNLLTIGCWGYLFPPTPLRS